MIYVFENENNNASWVKEDCLPDEYKINAIELDSLPVPDSRKDKQAVLKASKKENRVWLEYVDIPKSKEYIQTELNAKLLKDNANMQIELENQKKLNADLLTKIAELGGNANA